jgi:hypothetical protein
MQDLQHPRSGASVDPSTPVDARPVRDPRESAMHHGRSHAEKPGTYQTNRDVNTITAGLLLPNAVRMLRQAAFAVALILSLPVLLIAQENPYHLKEVMSREYGINVGAYSIPDIKEVVSREHSLFVGMGPDNQLISREFSLVLADTNLPPRITVASHTAAPDGSWVTLNWSGYNQWAVRDVDHYRVYYSDRAFSSVTDRVPLVVVRGEIEEFTAVGLPTLQDHFFAIVPVDALGNFFEDVRYFGVYILTQEVISREIGLFIGGEPDPPYREAVSREFSLVITDAELPPIVEAVTMTVSPSGDTVTLDWSGYNQWATRDVAYYAIYYSSAGPFHNVTGMNPLRIVPGEHLFTTFSGLAEWRDHFFAVVPVDGLGHFEPNILYRAAYVAMPQVISREIGLFVGAEPDPPYRQIVSREYSIVRGGHETPTMVTGLGSDFTARASQSRYGGVDLDWTHYNEWAQRDVVRYRIYLDTQFFDDVTGKPVYAYSANGIQLDTITGLDCEQIYYVAVVAEDVFGNYSNEVYSFSTKASVCELGDVFAFAPTPIYYGMRLDWDLGGVGTDLHFFVDHFRIYVNGSADYVSVPGDSRTYNLLDLDQPKEYEFRITTVDLEGTESAGQIVKATPLNVFALFPRQEAAGFRVSIATQLGYRYQLQRNDTVLGSTWEDIGPTQPGTGDLLEFTDPNPPAPSFYRFMVEP